MGIGDPRLTLGQVHVDRPAAYPLGRVGRRHRVAVLSCRGQLHPFALVLEPDPGRRVPYRPLQGLGQGGIVGKQQLHLARAFAARVAVIRQAAGVEADVPQGRGALLLVLAVGVVAVHQRVPVVVPAIAAVLDAAAGLVGHVEGQAVGALAGLASAVLVAVPLHQDEVGLAHAALEGHGVPRVGAGDRLPLAVPHGVAGVAEHVDVQVALELVDQQLDPAVLLADEGVDVLAAGLGERAGADVGSREPVGGRTGDLVADHRRTCELPPHVQGGAAATRRGCVADGRQDRQAEQRDRDPGAGAGGVDWRARPSGSRHDPPRSVSRSSM